MKIYYRLVTACLACFFVACAAIPTSSSINPWEYPNRGFSISSSEEQARFLASLQPCIRHANSTFPDVLRRYKAGLLEGAGLRAKIFDDEDGWSWVRVHVEENSLIHGQTGVRQIIKEGKFYNAGSRISIKKSDVIDWYVIYQDRPPEGNWLGKYILLKQDGLAPSNCDPNDVEMQRFRLFEWEYSLVPPWTEGWEVHGRTKDWDLHVQDKRDFPNELNTFSSSRRQIPIINSSQELVAMTKEVMEKGHQDTNRYTILRHEVGVYKTNKAMCARSQLALTDKKALISKSGKRGPMMRDVETLACVHPSNKNMVVMMVYSHRYQSGNRDAEFVEKASRTFNSLAFTKKN